MRANRSYMALMTENAELRSEIDSLRRQHDADSGLIERQASIIRGLNVRLGVGAK